MNIFRRPGPGRRHSEQLLDGAGRTPATLTDLAGLLEAARSAPAGGPLPGEDAAVAAFLAARSTSSVTAAAVAPTRKEIAPVRTLAMRRIIAVKVLAAAALTTTVGGVAFAASTGSIPSITGTHHRSAAATEHSPTEQPTGSPADHPTGSPSHPGRTSSDDPSGRADQRPGGNRQLALLIVCRNWTMYGAKADSHATRADHGRRLADLVKAAGGKDKVAAFCAALAEKYCPTVRPGAHGASPSAVPGFLPGCPIVSPSRRPSTHPSGTKPPTRPGPTHTWPGPGPLPGSPTGRPSGMPTDPPTMNSNHA